MNNILATIFLLVSMFALAEEQISMNFQNEDILKIIETYSKASGQKFVIDPVVRGKATILIPGKVSLPEAFNQLSNALAVNGYAITKRADTMLIMSTRNVQRDLIEVGTETPSVNPTRMYTWIYKMKNLSAEKVRRDIRTLNSKDGELAINTATNQIIVTDWTSNINRISEIMNQIDVKPDSLAKAIQSHKAMKEQQEQGMMGNE